jgi:hypothetical protein
MTTRAQYERHDGRPLEDHIVQFQGVSSEEYERLPAMGGDHYAPRIAYLEETVEIMSPSQSHEGIKSKIGRLAALTS